MIKAEEFIDMCVDAGCVIQDVARRSTGSIAMVTLEKGDLELDCHFHPRDETFHHAAIYFFTDINQEIHVQSTTSIGNVIDVIRGQVSPFKPIVKMKIKN